MNIFIISNHFLNENIRKRRRIRAHSKFLQIRSYFLKKSIQISASPVLLHYNAAFRLENVGACDDWKPPFTYQKVQFSIPYTLYGIVIYVIYIWYMVWYMKQPVDIKPCTHHTQTVPYIRFACPNDTNKTEQAHSQSDFMYTSFCFWHEKQIVVFIVWNHVVKLCCTGGMTVFQSLLSPCIIHIIIIQYVLYIYIFRCFRLRWECALLFCCFFFKYFLRLIEVKCSRVICAIRMVNIICLLLLFAEKPADLICAKYRHKRPGHLSKNVKRKREWRKGCTLNMHVETETNRKSWGAGGYGGFGL